MRPRSGRSFSNTVVAWTPLTLIEENVVCPFRAKLIGETIEVTDFAWPESDLGLKVQCQYKGKTYLIDITSLEWTNPLPEGFEWIEAYFEWLKGF